MKWIKIIMGVFQHLICDLKTGMSTNLGRIGTYLAKEWEKFVTKKAMKLFKITLRDPVQRIWTKTYSFNNCAPFVPFKDILLKLQKLYWAGSNLMKAPDRRQGWGIVTFRSARTKQKPNSNCVLKSYSKSQITWNNYRCRNLTIGIQEKKIILIYHAMTEWTKALFLRQPMQKSLNSNHIDTLIQ